MALDIYSVGTVAVTQGSPIVTLSGVGAAWLEAWAIRGNDFKIAGESQSNGIKTWLSINQVELQLPVARTTAAGLAYSMLLTAPAFGTNRQGAMTNIERIRLMTENAGLADFLGVGTNGLVAPSLADRLAGFDASNSNAIVPMQLRELLRAGTRVLAKSADYTVTTDDYGALIAMSAGTGARVIALPAAATAGAGFVVGFKKSDNSANTVTIDPAGAETVDDAATLVLTTKGATFWLRCDGTGWQEVGVGGNQSAFIRTFLDDPDGPAARTTLDVAQKQSSAGDKTAGRGLIVGAYGAGSETAPGIGDCNLAVESGLYLLSAGANSPESGGVLETISRTASTKYQFFYGNSGQIYWRWWNGTVWAAWVSFSGIGGSNVNGEFYRLAGGLQICISPTLSADSTTAAGNIFRSAETTWTLPASFANGGFAVMPSARGATTFWCAGRAVSTSAAAFTVFTTASQASRTIQLAAIGAW